MKKSQQRIWIKARSDESTSVGGGYDEAAEKKSVAYVATCFCLVIL